MSTVTLCILWRCGRPQYKDRHLCREHAAQSDLEGALSHALHVYYRLAPPSEERVSAVQVLAEIEVSRWARNRLRECADEEGTS